VSIESNVISRRTGKPEYKDEWVVKTDVAGTKKPLVREKEIQS